MIFEPLWIFLSKDGAAAAGISGVTRLIRVSSIAEGIGGRHPVLRFYYHSPGGEGGYLSFACYTYLGLIRLTSV